ncbi:MAG: hypothetical protein EOO99_04570 [Pedobacter sp.]|nr:MAG: hypothetical protein EOO99_04570 [Pedobacter sp.]
MCTSLVNLLHIGAKEKGIELQLNIAHNVPTWVIVDSLRLNQILMNLLGNAIKFTEKGKVILTVEMLKQKTNHIELAFSVKDTGIGKEILQSKLQT